MWRRVVLWQATFLLVGALDLTYYTRTRLYPPVPRVECFDYPEFGTNRHTRDSLAGWIHSKPPNLIFDGGSYSTTKFSRRVDFLPTNEDMMKEHAKLVQDINSLKQKLYVAPLDKTGDYDDPIYLEEIEMTTTLQPSVTSVLPKKKKPASSIPVLLVGGASQSNVIMSPLSSRGPVISLVGTSVSPLLKHPYPFVGHLSATPTVRICMPSRFPTAPVYAKPTPNLLQRILDGIVSKL